MFPYRVKYTDYESDTQNNDLLYKTDQKCQNTFENFEFFRENQKSIFFKNSDFKMISVLWRFVWPAFGGPKILVYIYCCCINKYICIGRHHQLGSSYLCVGAPPPYFGSPVVEARRTKDSAEPSRPSRSACSGSSKDRTCSGCLKEGTCSV